MGEAYLGEVLVAEGLALTVSVPPENRLVRMSVIDGMERGSRDMVFGR
jgi:hypothetical protein